MAEQTVGRIERLSDRDDRNDFELALNAYRQLLAAGGGK